ncbi:MAG: hypothetical protein LBD70_05445 [Bifidobacteriaceae bacterium]|jgi:hypothetical protein|nr:hypothetical protein [Bifidobacteriaceae bacterium]
MRRTPSRARLAGAASVIVALTAALAGCAQPVPEVKAPPKPAEPPAVVQSVQIDRILQELSADLERAASESSVEGLTGRVGGAALTMVEAQYAARAAGQKAIFYELGTSFVAGQIVARADDWPRSFVAVTDSAPTEAPFIYQLEQADARSPYKLVLWARLLAGATVPPATAAAVGSEVVADDESVKLAMAPAAALEAYARAKDDPVGADAQLFDTALRDGRDPDPAREAWTALVKGWTDTAALVPASAVAASSKVVDHSVYALATTDSGALVFGQVESSVEFEFAAAEGLYVDIAADKGYGGLGPSTLRVSRLARIDQLQTVVLAVPPAGADQPIRVIAVADLPTAVLVE